MKYLIIFSVLLTQFALAANPDQDLIVDLVRERFAASRPATIADVQLGKTWTCAIYSGQRGIMPNYNNYQELFLFEKTSENQILNKKDFPFSIFTFTATSASASAQNATMHMRVASNGALVFENVGKQPKKHKAYRSITDGKGRALDYIYCK